MESTGTLDGLAYEVRENWNESKENMVSLSVQVCSYEFLYQVKLYRIIFPRNPVVVFAVHRIFGGIVCNNLFFVCIRFQ